MLNIDFLCQLLYDGHSNQETKRLARKLILEFQKSNDDDGRKTVVKLNDNPAYEEREIEQGTLHSVLAESKEFFGKIQDVFFSSLQDKKNLYSIKGTDKGRHAYMIACQQASKAKALQKAYYKACKSNDEFDFTNLSQWVGLAKSSFGLA